MKGVVMFYNVKRGYGKIRGNDGNSYFVHKSQLPFWSIFLKKGEHVLFDVQDAPRGPCAINIRVDEGYR